MKLFFFSFFAKTHYNMNKHKRSIFLTYADIYKPNIFCRKIHGSNLSVSRVFCYRASTQYETQMNLRFVADWQSSLIIFPNNSETPSWRVAFTRYNCSCIISVEIAKCLCHVLNHIFEAHQVEIILAINHTITSIVRLNIFTFRTFLFYVESLSSFILS